MDFRTWNITIAVGLAALMTTGQAFANVYAVSRDVDGATATGFIETDGTLGQILLPNVIDWEITLAVGGNPVIVLTPANAAFINVSLPIEATPTELQGFSGGAGTIQICETPCNFGFARWLITTSNDIYEEVDFFDTTPFFVRSPLVEMFVIATRDSDDCDGDGVADQADNCVDVANADQRDTNSDGIGNACDADLNGDCQVNFGDLAGLKAAFTPRPYDPDADFDGDGFVNFGDLALMKSTFFSGENPGPGPSGVPNICDGAPTEQPMLDSYKVVDD